jgi:cytochrome b
MANKLVWSKSLRLLHWLLAGSMIASFATHEGGGKVHEWTGYLALGAACLRVGLGLFGARQWLFSYFLEGPKVTLKYAKSVFDKTAPRYLGHNPLGGWMMLALLFDAIATGLTGWLYTTDRFWGLAWLGEMHNALGHALLPLLFLHIAGAIYTSISQRENLIASMLHGRKRAAGPDDLQARKD